MAKLVHALWKYAGYGSLSRSLFDADLGDGVLSADRAPVPYTPLSEPESFEHGDDGDNREYSSDEETLLAWAHHLSSDEESGEEEEEEEEEGGDEKEPWDDSGYESGLSEDFEPFYHQNDWNADGGGGAGAGQGDYILSIGPYCQED